MSGQELVVGPSGSIRMIYGESFSTQSLGGHTIRRASHVEPTDNARWTADLSPVGGPLLGPFTNRTAALEAETAWLAKHWLDEV